MNSNRELSRRKSSENEGSSKSGPRGQRVKSELRIPKSHSSQNAKDDSLFFPDPPIVRIKWFFKQASSFPLGVFSAD